MRYYAGIDYGESWSDFAVIDHDGHVVAHTRVQETPAGVAEIVALLRGLSTSHRHSRKQVPIAIETSRGLLVAALRAAGQPVVAINPTVVARYRGRISPARKKADRTDAGLLAHILRVDGHLHRQLASPTPQALAITELAHAQQRTARTQRYHANQLRSHLRIFHPAMLQAWADLPNGLLRAEARAVLALGPTPRQAARLTKRKIADTLAAAGRTRMIDFHAGRLRELFREPQLLQPALVEEAMGQGALASLGLLNAASHAVEETTAHLGVAFRAHPDSGIYLSMPGCGDLIGARLLAEIGDDRARFATAKGLRSYAGAAPLTWASGGSSAVTARRVANKALKGTGHIWAFASLTRSPGARAYYDRRRAEGDRYPAALRRLFGRLLNSLYTCLQRETTYREDIAFPPAADPSALPAVGP